ncbi:MAG: hypothetical protein A3G76_12105 [Acidobacteria bacterium RIFCSPLOWO2_12_FULL_65_11]|nr:MAG: hypothetical protein A3H95_05750 [Acidobacteria bacterium RIFCSPLOWO2_02_FULL_64_15]OFW28298.1 MAG: hypothetical protein A3G76_12105 [Acidobacteria bacterium RIFCSPLOWO2_12_FULL_65_11]
MRSVLNLRRGELVEVRSLDEILATLDDRARFEALPFMPEMLPFIGRRFRVAGRADSTCDRVERKGLRTMTDAVHLEDVRCDGASHDGCEAACLIYWKEAWLKRGGADTRQPESGDPDSSVQAAIVSADARSIFTSTRASDEMGTGELRYRCQATEALDYTSPRAAGQKHSYWQDVRCGNVRWHEAVRATLVERFNTFQQGRGGTQYPPLGGSGTTTPTAALDLRPGEFVQVRTRDEIFQTLDAEGHNRGLSFDREMLMYCGGTYQVLKRVTRIIDEPTGRMIPMKRDCIILDGVVCTSRYHGPCRRAIYPFWREIWLTRAPATAPAARTNGEGSFVGFVLTSALNMMARRLLGRAQRAHLPKSSR